MTVRVVFSHKLCYHFYYTEPFLFRFTSGVNIKICLSDILLFTETFTSMTVPKS